MSSSRRKCRWSVRRTGLLKHIIHEKMKTKEMCLDIYMHFIPSGKRSGKHRHLSEEVFMWSRAAATTCIGTSSSTARTPSSSSGKRSRKKFEWTVGDFVYIPPYCAHQHVSVGSSEVRIVVMNSRIVKAMGFDWFEQTREL